MRVLFFVLAISLFLLPSCADEQYEASGPFVRNFNNAIKLGPEDSTKLKWDATKVELGSKKRGPEMIVEFPFKNSGRKPLIIDSVLVDCGCTSFSLPANPVQPGKKGIIKVKFASDAQPLAFLHKNIHLRANTKGNPYHTLGFTIELTE